MIARSVSTQQRFRRYGEHCPICGGHCGMKQGKGERCAGYLSLDGEYVFCTRPEQAGNLELNEKTTPSTFCHKLYGACKCGKEHNPERSRTSSNGHRHWSKKEQRKPDDLPSFGGGSLEKDRPIYIIAMQKEKQASLVHDV